MFQMIGLKCDLSYCNQYRFVDDYGSGLASMNCGILQEYVVAYSIKLIGQMQIKFDSMQKQLKQ